MYHVILYLSLVISVSVICNGDEFDNNISSGNESSATPPFIGCSDEPLPNSTWEGIEVFVIDLDKLPEERWKELVLYKKDELTEMVTTLKNNSLEIFGDEVFKIIDKYIPWLTKTLPKEYYEELIGISAATDITVGEVTLFNIFYEFYSACTSIVMQGADKKIYLGRNLDFGFLLGWDVKNRTWIAPELLRPLVVQLEFQKENRTIFEAISFAGYTGILTAVKKDSFALSVNERFRLDGGYIGLAEWILGRHNQKWLGILTREVMQTAESFTEAQKMLFSPALIAPVYFILAGRKPNQGCVITRGRHDSDIWNLNSADDNTTDSWFLTQTNYDHWKRPPFYDNRLDPANKCMKEFGSENPKETLYRVLSTRPVLNKLTTFTALIDVSTGELSSWIRDCEDPCWPW